MTLSFRTKDRHGYSVQFSPYTPTRLACSTSQYYGIAGRGTLFILDVTEKGLVPVRVYDWNDGLFDVTWAENNENVIIVGAGDGSILLFDVVNSKGPLRAYKEHTKEVNSVHWSQTRNENFIVSGSWDSLIKVWSVESPKSLSTYAGHQGIVYEVAWSPLVPGSFASASGDKTVCIWDRRTAHQQITIPAHREEVLCCDWSKYDQASWEYGPRSVQISIPAHREGALYCDWSKYDQASWEYGPRSVQISIPAHREGALYCDWSKYDQHVLFSGSVDCSIKGWDIRNPQSPLCEMTGHRFAVRRVKASPFSGNALASCSYDFTVRTWDVRQPHAMETIEHHTEFVYGLDFNLHVPGQIVDCGWDEKIQVHRPRSL